MTTYTTGVKAATTRSVAACATPGAAGIIVPNWQSLLVSSSGTTVARFSPETTEFGTSPVLDGQGFSGAAIGSDGTIWLVSYGGYVLSAIDTFPIPTFSSAIASTLPKGLTYIGLVCIGATPYIASSSGRVFTISSGAYSEVSANFGGAISALATDGTRLLATQPSVGYSMAVLTFSGSTATLSHETPPITFPTTLSATSSGTFVAGYANAVQSGGTSAMAIQPGMIVESSSSAGTITLLTGADPSYQSQAPVSVPGANALIWSADGEQVLVASTAGLDILTLTTGVLSVTQTLSSLTGVSSLATTPTGDEALVCQPGSNQVAVILNSLHTWSLGTPVSITSPNCVLILSSLRAVVGTSSGISYLVRSGSTWSVEAGTSVALASVQSITAAYGSGGGFYVGIAGAVFLFSSTGSHILISTWIGSAVSILSLRGQTAVLDASNNLLRWFDNAGNAQGTTAVPSGAVSVVGDQSSVWVVTSGSGSFQYVPYAPFTLRFRRVGVVAVTTNGSSWSTQILAVGFTPSSVLWSGTTVYMSTIENEVLEFNVVSLPTFPSPTILAIGPYSNQSTTALLGLNALVSLGSHVYAPTLASGQMATVV